MTAPPLTPELRAELRAAVDMRRRALEEVVYEPPNVTRSGKPSLWQHGTEYGYCKQGCRCAPCIEAARAARGARRRWLARERSAAG